LLFLATTEPVDLSFFFGHERGTTTARPRKSSLAIALGLALCGEREDRFRERPRPCRVSAYDTWTATSRSFRLEKAR
jgi:hypothetical protein